MGTRAMVRSLAVALILLAPGLRAQSNTGAGGGGSGSDAGIFDSKSFENAVKESQAQEKKNALSYLVGGSFLSDTQAVSSTAFDGYTTAGSLSGKAFAKVTVPTYGQLYLSYDVQHTIFQGAGGSMTAAPIGSDLFSNSYELSEFFYDFDIAKRLYLRLGNQLVAWGPSNVWTPVDFINSRKASSLETIDLRTGKPGIKLFLPFRSWDVTLFSDFSGSIQGGAVTDITKTTNVALRTAVTVGDFEIGVSGYVGESTQTRYGFDFSGDLLGAVVYGELALLVPSGGYDSGYAGSMGFSRSFGDLKRWSAQAEFFYQSGGTNSISDYPVMIASGGFVPLYVGRGYGYAAITKRQLGASFLDVTASGLSNLSDGSYLAKLASAFSIPGIVPFTLSLSYSGGGAGKEFTYFTGNDGLTMDLQILVQF